MTNTAPETLHHTEYKAVMPSPSCFDFLPMIHALTSRLLLDPTDQNALQPKQIVAAVAEIKHHIQRAREMIEGLPDIGTSMASQEREIEHVHVEIARQRSQLGDVLSSLRGLIGKDGI